MTQSTFCSLPGCSLGHQPRTPRRRRPHLLSQPGRRPGAGVPPCLAPPWAPEGQGLLARSPAASDAPRLSLGPWLPTNTEAFPRGGFGVTPGGDFPWAPRLLMGFVLPVGEWAREFLYRFVVSWSREFRDRRKSLAKGSSLWETRGALELGRCSQAQRQWARHHGLCLRT